MKIFDVEINVAALAAVALGGAAVVIGAFWYVDHRDAVLGRRIRRRVVDVLRDSGATISRGVVAGGVVPKPMSIDAAVMDVVSLLHFKPDDAGQARDDRAGPSAVPQPVRQAPHAPPQQQHQPPPPPPPAERPYNPLDDFEPSFPPTPEEQAAQIAAQRAADTAASAQASTPAQAPPTPGQPSQSPAARRAGRKPSPNFGSDGRDGRIPPHGRKQPTETPAEYSPYNPRGQRPMTPKPENVNVRIEQAGGARQPAEEEEAGGPPDGDPEYDDPAALPGGDIDFSGTGSATALTYDPNV